MVVFASELVNFLLLYVIISFASSLPTRIIFTIYLVMSVIQALLHPIVPAVNEDVISVFIGSLFRDLPEGLRNMTKNLADLVIFTLQFQAAFQSCGL